jgi:hypothetical protein
MSLAATRQSLVKALDNQDTKVIALQGPWGTGKSHLWSELHATSTNAQVTAAVYASLFGLTDLGTLKLKLVQSLVPAAANKSGVTEGAVNFWHGARDVLRDFSKKFDAIDNIAMLAVPTLLRGRLIVLDDIERRHAKLELDGLLGFIDEYSREHECRFLLILNTSKLGQAAELWSTLREKVLDQEIALQTTPSEALDLALKLAPSTFPVQVRNGVHRCGLTNIRIIAKCLAMVNQVMHGRESAPTSFLDRYIPKVVFFAAVHFRSDIGVDWSLLKEIYGGDPAAELPDTLSPTGRTQWLSYKNSFNLNHYEFERSLVSMLESGASDMTAVTPILDRDLRGVREGSRRDDVWDFIERVQWDPSTSSADLLAAAKPLIADAKHLSVRTASEFHECLSKIEGGSTGAAELLKLWLEALAAGEPATLSDRSVEAGNVQEDMKNAIRNLPVESHKKSLSELCALLSRRDLPQSGKDRDNYDEALPMDFIEEILQLPWQDLKKFLSANIAMLADPDPFLYRARRSFLIACGQFNIGSENPRYRKVIRHAFDIGGQLAKLDSLYVSEPSSPRPDQES